MIKLNGRHLGGGVINIFVDKFEEQLATKCLTQLYTGKIYMFNKCRYKTLSSQARELPLKQEILSQIEHLTVKSHKVMNITQYLRGK